MPLRTLLRNGFATLMSGSANAVLRHDTATLDALARLDGKIIQLHITPPDESWFCLPGNQGLSVSTECDNAPNIIISGSLPALLLLALHVSRNTATVNTSSVCITGDHELLQDVMRIVHGFDIDWEALLARATGDVIAHQAGRMARNTGKWADGARSELARQLTGYVQEELQLLPTHGEVSSFCNDVDALSLATERLQARLQQLAQTTSAGHTP